MGGGAACSIILLATQRLSWQGGNHGESTATALRYIMTLIDKFVVVPLFLLFSPSECRFRDTFPLDTVPAALQIELTNLPRAIGPNLTS